VIPERSPRPGLIERRVLPPKLCPPKLGRFPIDGTLSRVPPPKFDRVPLPKFDRLPAEGKLCRVDPPKFERFENEGRLGEISPPKFDRLPVERELDREPPPKFTPLPPPLRICPSEGEDDRCPTEGPLKPRCDKPPKLGSD